MTTDIQLKPDFLPMVIWPEPEILVIDRSRWCRIALTNNKKEHCVLGFWAEAHGYRDDVAPINTTFGRDDARLIAHINDSYITGREEALAEVFLRHNIKLKFIGERGN